MKNEKCSKITRFCEECLEHLSACLNHDEYFICDECGCRMPIGKAEISRRSNLIFNKAFGAKPVNPENN